MSRSAEGSGRFGGAFGVVGGEPAQPGADGVGQVGLGPRPAIDAHVPQPGFEQRLLPAEEIELRRDARRADPGQLHADLDHVVEARRGEEALVGLRDDEVDAQLRVVLPQADRLAPELREGGVDVEQVVGVEDDPLGIALAVADAQLVDVGVAQRRRGVRPTRRRPRRAPREPPR